MAINGDSIEWPAWLLGERQDISLSLDRIAAIHTHLLKSAEKTSVHRRLATEQFAELMDRLEEQGAMANYAEGDPVVVAGGIKGASIPSWMNVSAITQMVDAHKHLRQMLAANHITVVRLLNAFRLCTVAGDFLVPLIVLRSLFEHVSVLHSLLRCIKKLKEDSATEPARKVLMRIREEITKRAYGTRISWNGALFHPSDRSIPPKALKYKPKPTAVDRTAKQVLNALDDLDTEVEGTRAVYEILCEFAHPNLGAVVISTEKRGPETDNEGLVWNEHVLRSGPPIAFVHATGELVPRVLAQTAVCLAITRTSAKRHIRRSPDSSFLGRKRSEHI